MVRLLRLAAAVVAIAAIAAVVLPMLWWRAQKVEQAALFHDTYLYVDAAGTIGMLIAAAAVVLILLAQARILERLDAIQGSAGERRGPAK